MRRRKSAGGRTLYHRSTLSLVLLMIVLSTEVSASNVALVAYDSNGTTSWRVVLEDQYYAQVGALNGHTSLYVANDDYPTCELLFFNAAGDLDASYLLDAPCYRFESTDTRWFLMDAVAIDDSPWVSELSAFTPDGQQVWAKEFQDTCFEFIRAFPDDGVAVFGEGKIIRFDRNGKTLWEANCDLSGFDVQVSVDGETTMVARGHDSDNGNGINTVAQFDPDGNEMWSVPFGEIDLPGFRPRMVNDREGNTFAVGDCGQDAGCLVKIDSLGNSLWSNEFVLSENGSQGVYVAVDPSGQPVVAAENDYHVAVLKYSEAGNLLWDMEISEDLTTQPGAIPDGLAIDGSGNIFLVASFCDEFGYDGCGGFAQEIVLINQNGIALWKEWAEAADTESTGGNPVAFVLFGGYGDPVVLSNELDSAQSSSDDDSDSAGCGC